MSPNHAQRRLGMLLVLIGLLIGITLPLVSRKVAASAEQSDPSPILSGPASAQENLSSLNIWSSHGPEGGQVLSLAIDRSNPATIYAGAGGGVFKSTNGGESWTVSLSPDYNHGTYTLVIDPISSTTVYAAGNFGVFKSTDGGASWHTINKGLANQYGNAFVRALAIDPRTPTTLYVAGQTADNHSGISKSIDGGTSWQTINKGLPIDEWGNAPGVSALAIDPNNPNIVYVSGGVPIPNTFASFPAIFKSTDRGTNWSQIFNGYRVATYLPSLVVDPFNSNTIYAGGNAYDCCGGVVLKSTNGGGSWSQSNLISTVSALAIDPTNSNIIYAGGTGVFKSTNGGQSWSASNGGVTNLGGGALAIDPINPSIVYAEGNGVYKSSNAGVSWAAINSGLRGGVYATALAIEPGSANTIYTETGYGGVFKSTDNGGIWTPSDFYPLAFDPRNPNTIYARRITGRYGLLKSTNGGATWTATGLTVFLNGSRYLSTLAIDPGNSEVIYAGLSGTGGGVFKSMNGGESWSQSSDVPGGISTLAIDPRNSNIIYAGGLGAFKSTDGGGNWNAVGNLYYIQLLVIDPGNSQTLYALACANANDDCDSYALYKSTDGGGNWNSTGSSGSVLALDPAHPNVVYVGTYQDGVFRSADGGASWNPLNDGLTNLNIYALAINSSGNFLHAGTPAGVFDIQLATTATPTPTPTPTATPSPTPTSTPTPGGTPSATPTPATIWSAPVNLGSLINSASSEQQPASSPDGLSLYFTSNRLPSLGGFDIFVSQRARVDDAWGPPVNLGPALNTDSDEGNAAFSRDGRLLFFQSKRNGGLGGIDIWLARRNNPRDDFDWQPAVNLGSGVNSSVDDNGPTYFEDIARGTRQLYFGSARTGGPGGADIYVSAQSADGSFGPATLVTELSSTSPENDPSIRHDGLEIFFQSSRAGSIGTALDLWVATRGSTLDAWSTPVNLGDAINTTSLEQNPYLSSDGITLFFASDRAVGSGGLDLYMATRTALAAGPNWTNTGNLNQGRQSHTATLLPNGKVLIAGGNDGNRSFKSAELYDPATGRWSRTSDLNADRDSHTATLLPNGKVLVAGGFSCGPPPQSCFALTSAELYDPATGIWTVTGSLNTARNGHNATLLPNGKVLVVSGDINGKSAELYDAATGIWSPTGSLNLSRYSYTLTLLSNGKVLVAGGADDSQTTVFNSAELYDPATGLWSSTGNLVTARAQHTATLLTSGKVMVAGGFIDYSLGSVTDRAELYDPTTGLWSSTGNLNRGRAFHVATLLTTGKVLVAGGFFVDGFPNITNRAELYDPTTGIWSNTTSLNAGRRFFMATLLLNGKVIAAGGNGFNAANTSELYGAGSEPVVLPPDQVTIKSWTYQGRTYAHVKLSFSNSGYSVIDWGLATRSGNDFTVNALVERSSGASVQAVTTTAQIYDLGPLANGTYNFNFKTSGTLAKTLQFTISSTVPPPNPIDTAREFVKQQYRDFLNREADQAGEDFWTDNITKCNDPARRPAGQTVEQCTLRQRETTSGAFFLSPEFQYTGYYVYRAYQGALGRQPKLSEFIPDTQFVGNGIVVNGQLSAAKINQNKADFAQQFVNCTDATKYRCAEFKAIYDPLSNQQYVDKLFQTTGVNASAAERTALVNGLNGATETRATVLQKVVDGINVISEGNQQFTTTYGHAFYDQQFNRAFVQLEYFGYMKRDPDDAGYAFWLGKLNQFGGDFINAEMVLAFISSPEYRARFGQP